ncbi:MAG: phosphotransferase [Chitinophagaceae bacterium]|nr:phosphotransferase [Chitinophagaceae bacterium]
MENTQAMEAARQFGKGRPEIQVLKGGLIHHTYKVSYDEQEEQVVLQCINQTMFHHPEDIIHNYQLVYEAVHGKEGITIPPIIPARNGKLYWLDADGQFWRAIRFVSNSYTALVPQDAAAARLTANCFANFTSALASVELNQLRPVIPRFHDLAMRYDQFEKAILTASQNRLLTGTHVIAELRQRHHLVEFYNEIVRRPDLYWQRVMHHDCKLSNILLDVNTHQAICPVDLDTVMPGLYFSDLGDMIRSMACSVDENSTDWEAIAIRPDFYEAIVEGYRCGMGDQLTSEEKENIHQAGLIMVYMQSLRFITDHLNNDVYYQISYPEQNLNRALNQLLLLEKLEEYISVTSN